MRETYLWKSELLSEVARNFIKNITLSEVIQVPHLK